MSWTSGVLQVQWVGMDDRRYVIQHAPRLGEPFQSLPGKETDLPGDGTALAPASSNLGPAPDSSGFYRVRYLQRLD